ERLGKHIGWNTAWYTVEYRGDALPIKLEMVEWRRGKAREPRLWGRDFIRENSEASLVIRRVEDVREELPAENRAARDPLYLLSSILGKIGPRTGYFVMPALKSETEGHGRMEFFTSQDEPVELTKDHPVALCAFFAGDGLDIQPGDESFEEKAKRIEWAAVF